MKKRLFTSALATVMTFSSIAVMSANAIAHIPVRSDSEEYQKKIKEYDEYYQRLSEEEIDTFYNIVADSFECIEEENNITNVWVLNKSTDDTTFPYSRFDTYLFEYSLDDYFRINFKLPMEESEAIYSELSNAWCNFRL